MFHLHGFQDQQGVALADLLPLLRHDADQLAGQRGRDGPAGQRILQIRIDRVDQFQFPLSGLAQHGQDVAVAGNQRTDPVAVDPRQQLAGPVQCAIRHHRTTRQVQHHAATTPVVDRDFRRGFVTRVGHHLPPVIVQPPAIDRVPGAEGIIGVGTGRRLPAFGDHGQGGQRQHRVVNRRNRWQQLILESLDEAGIQIGGVEGRMGDKLLQEEDIGHQPGNPGPPQHSGHAPDRLRPVLAVHDQLGDHRVIERGDAVALPHPGIDAQAVAARPGIPVREPQPGQLAGGGQEHAVRVLGIEPHLQRVPVDGQVILRQRQRFPRRDPDLPLHQVLPGDQFGHRMLHLQAGIHLHEVETVRAQPLRHVGNELDGAGTVIVDGTGGSHRRLPHGLAHVRRHVRGGRFLDHLLVAALDGAVTLEQMHRIAVGVAEDLHLDMARFHQILLDQHTRVAEGVLALPHRAFQGLGEVLCLVDLPHALAAATGHGLDQHRITDARRLRRQHLRVLAFPMVSGDDRHAGLLHDRLGRILQAHAADRVRTGADEGQPGDCNRIRKRRVLGQETIAGMDRLRAGTLRRLQHPVGQQIAFRHLGFTDAHGLVGHGDMHGTGVGIGMHGDGADAHVAGGANDAAGDLAPVRDQDLVEQCHGAAPTSGTRRRKYPPAAC